MRWRREEGFEFGAVALNTVITFAALAIGLLIGSILSYPDIAVRPIIFALIGVAILMPVAIYPLTFTLWFAIDVLSHPPSTDELVEAAKFADSSNN